MIRMLLHSFLYLRVSHITDGQCMLVKWMVIDSTYYKTKRQDFEFMFSKIGTNTKDIEDSLFKAITTFKSFSLNRWASIAWKITVGVEHIITQGLWGKQAFLCPLTHWWEEEGDCKRGTWALMGTWDMEPREKRREETDWALKTEVIDVPAAPRPNPCSALFPENWMTF